MLRACSRWAIMLGVLACVALTIGAWATQAQDVNAEPPGGGARQAEPGTTLSTQLDLARLVDLCAERLKVSIEYDAATLRVPVTIRVPGPVSDADLWRLTNQILASRGFTTVRTPGGAGYSVVKLAEAAQAARVEVDSREHSVVPAGFASIIFKARHRPARELADSLRQVVGKQGGQVIELGSGSVAGGPTAGSAGNPGASGWLLISDQTPRLEQAERVLEMIDRPVEPAKVVEVPISQASPSDVAALANQLAAKGAVDGLGKAAGEAIASPTTSAVLVIAPDSAMESWKALLARLDVRQSVDTRTYTPRVFAAKDVARLVEQTVSFRGEGIDQAARVVTDELTGSLIITATPRQHERIEELIARLDASQQAAMPVRAFAIKNRPVRDVVETLDRLVAAGVLDAAGEGVSAPPTTPSTPSGSTGLPVASVPPASTSTSTPPASVAPSASVQRPSARSSLLPSGEAGGPTQRSSRLTITADEGTNTLIAVGEPRLLSQLESLLATIDVRQPQVMLEVMLVSLTEGQARSLGVELERLGGIGDTSFRLSSLFGLSNAGNEAGPSGGRTRTTPDAAGLTGVVLNPGEFSVIVKALQTLNKGRSSSMPRVLVNNNEQATFGSTVQQPVSTSVIGGSTSASGFGGYEEAGTRINVRPQIAEGDHLVLQYSLTLSSFVGSGTDTLPPPRQQNDVTSKATIPDGHTVVVGGLELVTESDGTSQIPILGDVPLLGELFKSKSKSLSTSRFFVFIRATVLRHNGFEDLKHLSQSAMGVARVDYGFPEVEPRVIK